MGQVSDPVRGILLDSGGLSEGRIRFDEDLAPGTYDVALAASGGIPWRGKAVVRSAGSEVEVTAALQRRPRAQGKGSVVVRTREAVPAPEAVARSPRTPAAAVGPEWCCVLLRRSGDTAWRDARAEERPDGSLDLHALNWSTAEGVSSAGIEEGSYDLLVARRDRGMAGMVRGVRIVGDRENLVDVPLRPGCVFRLTDLVDRDVAYRSVEVRCTEHGTLPLYALPPLTEGGFREEQTLRALLRVPLEPIELGPFPATEVEVVVTDAEGRARSFRAGGAR
jgi:hypothetical protein